MCLENSTWKSTINAWLNENQVKEDGDWINVRRITSHPPWITEGRRSMVRRKEYPKLIILSKKRTIEKLYLIAYKPLYLIYNLLEKKIINHLKFQNIQTGPVHLFFFFLFSFWKSLLFLKVYFLVNPAYSVSYFYLTACTSLLKCIVFI